MAMTTSGAICTMRLSKFVAVKNALVRLVNTATITASAGFVEPKTTSGRRAVPIARVLRAVLLEHRLRAGRSDGLVFGRSATKPPNHSTILARAAKAWQEESRRRATAQLEQQVGREPTSEEVDEMLPKVALVPIGLHEARHTFASLMIAAGVNAKALSTYMGHSSITITLDRYGHLMPGNEEQAAELLDAYLERTTTAAPVAQHSAR
jgi:integrase